MKTIYFADESFGLDASGLLIWPAQSTAIVADLHLEKASFFAVHGQLLPPQDTFETLTKLQLALNRLDCRSLILLGDSFHDAEGFDRLDPQAKELWEQICSDYSVTFVLGNHDGIFVPPDTQGVHFLEQKGIIFRHQAEIGTTAEISGHYHPKASLKLRGNWINRPCFIHDTTRMILPAFGTLTGGMDVKSAEISGLFADDFLVHLLGENKVYSVRSNKL